MSMDSIDEPSKWVCRLSTMFEKGTVPSNGTGFLVNLPYTKKFCIMTAGHNLKDPTLGHAIRVDVIFPNKLTFTATTGEFSVSKVYHENTTTDRDEESSISDYGLIFVDREKHKSLPGADLGGCAFSVLYTKSELFRMEVTVHGHKGGEEQQTKNTSSLSRVEFDTLFYFKRTEPGVSGGPVFISRDGTDIAVGIHNYNTRATRLTCQIVLEMLSWVVDYSLRRTFEVSNNPGVYLQTTKGSRPSIVARPGQDSYASFNLVVVEAPKHKPNVTPHFYYAIIPTHNRPREEGSLFFLTVIGNEKELMMTFCDGMTPQKDSIFTIWNKKKGQLIMALESDKTLAVQSRLRKHCDCGCITQDSPLELKKVGGTLFTVSSSKEG